MLYERIGEITPNERYSRTNNKPTQRNTTKAEENFTKEKITSNDVKMILGGIGMILLLGFPVAYLFQLCQVFTEFLYDMIGVFTGTGDSSLESNPMFYSGFWARYLYCVGLMGVVMAWCDGPKENMLLWSLQWLVALFFLFVAGLHLNLLLSTILGPFIIFIGLFITAKR